MISYYLKFVVVVLIGSVFVGVLEHFLTKKRNAATKGDV